MSGNCVALIVPDPEAARSVSTFLTEHIGRPPSVWTYETASDFLGQDEDGLVVTIRRSAQDEPPIAHLVQDLSLQQLSARVVLIELEESNEDFVASLSQHLTGVVRWPDERDKLTLLAQEALKCDCPFGSLNSSLEDTLRRQLNASTPSLAFLADRIIIAAKHDVTVLLTGETGTGKTHFARLIHDNSPRKQHKFMHVACGAVTNNLIESEFFGHVKGAFTGADRTKVGKFAAVGEGTLLLDEIDTLGLEQQATLLRVIETGEFEPVGSNETQKCQARLIVASNLLLDEAVEKEKFRPDLYYRLNVMSFHLPALRERTRDICCLARKMAAKFNRKFDKKLFDINPRALAALETYPWPGNIRQLENAIQHAVLLSDGPELLFEHLPDPIRDHTETTVPETTDDTNATMWDQQREASERNAVQRALRENGYSRSRAAAMLGISRVTLYKKMKKYGLMDIPLQSSPDKQ
ncbi:MAG: sigma-54 interaction domain-containing protein [Gemmataceae bacterium]